MVEFPGGITDGSPVQSTDEILAARGTSSIKVTAQEIADLGGGGGGASISLNDSDVTVADQGGGIEHVTITIDGAEKASFEPSEIQLNSAQADVDVRIRGDGSPNVFFTDASRDNVGILTSSVDPAAALAIGGTTKGFLPPTLTAVERDAIASPPEGLVVYNTGNDRLEVYDGSAWLSASISEEITIPNSNSRVAVIDIGGFDEAAVFEFNLVETVRIEAGLAHFNVDQGDRDFRIDGDTLTSLVHVDASADSVGVGVASPVATALLQMDSTTKGFLPPRMTTAQRTGIGSPEEGLVVYDTDDNALYVRRAADWRDLTVVGGGGGTFEGLSDTPSYTGNADRLPIVNDAETALEYPDSILVGASLIDFNAQGGTVDIRVQGDTLANLLRVDAATDSIGVNIANPDSSAILDVVSTTKGALLPRMTTAQRTAIGTPAEGLIVYDTDDEALYVRRSASWRDLTLDTDSYVATNLSTVHNASTVDIQSSDGSDAVLNAATTTTAGAMTGADKTKLDGIAAGAEVNVATNLTYTASTRLLESSTGADVTLPEVVAAGDSGLMTGADKTKLDGIAAGAEVNVAHDLSYTAATRELAITNGTNTTLPEVVAAGDSGLMTGTDKTKLDGIDAGASADYIGLSDTPGVFGGANRVVGVNGAGNALEHKSGMHIAAAQITMNPNGADIDVQVQGDTEANLLFVNAGDDSVGIATAAPVATAILQIDSTTRGFLPPRMTTAQRTGITTPAEGLIVHDTDLNRPYVYDGSSWVDLGQSGGGSGTNITIVESPTNVDVQSSTGSNDTIALATTVNAGVMAPGDKTKLDGIAAGAEVNVAHDLSYTASTRELAITNGTNATLPEVVAAGDSGLMTGSDKTKLDGIAAGAEVNVAHDLSYTASTRELAITNGTNATLPLAVAGGDAGLLAGADQTILDWFPGSLGSAGQILEVNPGATALQFVTPSSGGANLTFSRNATTVTVESDSGTDAVLPAATATLAGIFTAAEQVKLDGIAAGAEVNVAHDLSYTASTRELAITNGTNATLPNVVAAGDSGLMTGSDKTKLDGIAAGAEVNVAHDLSYTASTRELAITNGTNATLPEVVAAGDSGLMTGADKTKLDGIDSGASSDFLGLTDTLSSYAGAGSRLLRINAAANAVESVTQITATSGLININALGAAVDTQIQGDAVAPVIYVDASQDAVGMGVATPDGSALLELSSTTKGLLPPRMTTAQRTGISTPAEGLLVYDTDDEALYVRRSADWRDLTLDTGGGGGTYVGLSDTPNAFTGDASQLVRVNAAANALEHAEELTITTSQITLNAAGGNVDIQMQGDTVADTFFLDASQDSIGIGTNSVDATALLELDSTTKGLLFPRMTTTQRDALTTPPDGLVLYNTTTDALTVRANGAWVELGAGGGGGTFTGLSDTPGSITANQPLFGNSGGTALEHRDAIVLTTTQLRLNEQGANLDIVMEGDTNDDVFYLDASLNNIGIGTSTPDSDLLLDFDKTGFAGIGMLGVPHVTNADISGTSPKEGAIVYSTDQNAGEICFFNGTNWRRLSGQTFTP